MTDKPTTPEDNDLECEGSSDFDAFVQELGYSIELDEDQKATIRARSAELLADPSIGLSWAEVKERLAEARAIRRAPGFAEEAHAQSAAVAGSPDAAEDQAWVEAVQAWPDDEDQS